MAKKQQPVAPSEKLDFELHPAILWSIIKDQAGTLMKALQEGVQNSVDSGSTKCDITLTKDKVSIVDDGKGFVTREEIMKNFRTFGTPHVEGDATYGKYRMGRGQLFSFGRNEWRTNDYLFTVDIKPQEGSEKIGFALSECSPPQAGCRIDIDLYDKLRPSEVDATERELRRYLKFVQIPVTLNGEVINALPKTKKWTFETDDAYFDLKDTGNLDVYNLGVLVRSYPASQFGAGGTVVSKIPLGVNFARNDVASSCKVFKRISAKIRQTSVKDSVKKKRLNNAEWEALANDVRIGDSSVLEVFSTPLIKLVTGGMVSFADLRTRIGKFHNRIAVTPAKDHMGDRVMQRGVALVIDQETIERFGYGSLKEFCAGISKRVRKAAEEVKGDWSTAYKLRELSETLANVSILDKKDFHKFVRADHEDVPMAKLNAAEKFALQIVQRAAWSIGHDINRMVHAVRHPDHYYTQRTIEEFGLAVCQQMEGMCGKTEVPRARDVRVGESDAAEAWTDGEHCIWINRENLKLIAKGIPGMTRIAQLSLHEYLHQSPNTGDLNTHDESFYTTFHNLTIHTPIIGRAVNDMMDRAIRMVRHEKRKPTGALLKFEDQLSELTGEVISETAARPEADEDESQMQPLAAHTGPSM